jgi:uncharacterized protein YbcV (DUF1398 family)
MFTLEQIKHMIKYKRVLIFQYIQELIDLGVEGYDTLINDGHVAYYGIENRTDKKYDKIKIAATANKERFIEFLVMHQDGQTDYFTFLPTNPIGIAKSRIDIIEMTCTYFDASGNAIIIEKIPS